MSKLENIETGIAILFTLFITGLSLLVAWINSRQSVPDPASEK